MKLGTYIVVGTYLYIIYHMETYRMLYNYKTNNLIYNFMEQNVFCVPNNMLKTIERYFNTCMVHGHELIKLLIITI